MSRLRYAVVGAGHRAQTYVVDATLNCSLNAHSPSEGDRVAINGTEGRGELDVVERGAVHLDPITGRPTVGDSAERGNSDDPARPAHERLLVQRHWEDATEVPLANADSKHGGGDALLADVLTGIGKDPLHRATDWRDELHSIAVGIAGNLSLETGRPVRADDLGIPFPIGVSA